MTDKNKSFQVVSLREMLTEMAIVADQNGKGAEFAAILLDTAAKSFALVPGVRLGMISRIWLAGARQARDNKAQLLRRIAPLLTDIDDAAPEAQKESAAAAADVIATMMKPDATL